MKTSSLVGIALLAAIGSGACAVVDLPDVSRRDGGGGADMGGGGDTATGPDPCASYSSCELCTINPGCGFCRGTGECVSGSTTAPLRGRCDLGWVTSASACGGPDGGGDTPVTPRPDVVVADVPASPCPAGQFDCNGRCTNLRGTDATNCGRCGNRCGNGSNACSAGTCVCTTGVCEGAVLHCAEGSTVCLSGCRNFQADPLSCGACGVVCAAGESCVAGRCCAGSACSSCGDGRCRRPYEDTFSCPADCPAVCGDGACSAGETCASCAADCRCAAGQTCTAAGVCMAPPRCGDGACNGAETCASCAGDCGACARCGDGVCNGLETRASCSLDCGACGTADYTVPCGTGRCPSRSTCTGGGTSCTCNTGLLMVGCDGLACLPSRPCSQASCMRLGCGASNFIIPCAVGGAACPNNSTCSADGRSCACDAGYRAVTCEGRECGAPGVTCGPNSWWCATM